MGYSGWLKKEKIAKEYILGLGIGVGFYFLQIYITTKWTSLLDMTLGAAIILLLVMLLYFPITFIAYLLTEIVPNNFRTRRRKK